MYNSEIKIATLIDMEIFVKNYIDPFNLAKPQAYLPARIDVKEFAYYPIKASILIEKQNRDEPYKRVLKNLIGGIFSPSTSILTTIKSEILAFIKNHDLDIESVEMKYAKKIAKHYGQIKDDNGTQMYVELFEQEDYFHL